MNIQKEKEEELETKKIEEEKEGKIEENKTEEQKDKIENKIEITDNKEVKKEKNEEVVKEKNNKVKKNNYKNVVVLFFIVIILFIFSVIFSILNMNNKNIIKGIYINEIDVSNMSKEEAIDTLNKVVNEKIKNGIIISHKITAEDSQNENNETETKTTFENFEINYNIKEAVDNAYNVGRLGNIFENNFTILNLLIKNKNLNINISYNEDKVDSQINEISTKLPNKVVQSSYYLDEENSNLVITSGTSGNSIDKDEFIILLKFTLNDLKANTNYIDAPIKNVEPDKIDIDKIYNEVYKEPKNAYYEENPFKVNTEIKGISFDKDKAKEEISCNKNEYIIPLNITQPDITIKDLNINIFPDKIAAFTTKYDVSNRDRSTNLRLATEKINGTILAPGEEFSYNKIVGERSIQAGYKEAKVYSNGEVVDGIGGGICQISSTLYNAVVFSNLEVKERYNHQFITSYVGAGRDATVVYGVKDFKFVNNRTYPIKIEMSVNNGIAEAIIYGIKEDVEYNIDFDVETVSILTPTVQYENDNSLTEGNERVKQKGANGRIVNVYKVKKLNGAIVSRDLISQDTYNAMKKIIIKGTGKVYTPEPVYNEETNNQNTEIIEEQSNNENE